MNADLQQPWQWRSRDHFPTKLHALLELAASGGLGAASGAVAWLPHGRAFRIVREGEFMNAVAPLFFRMKQIRSFHRQLNLWGFKRISDGPDAGAWYHEHFLRGCPDGIRKIARLEVKGKFKRKGKSARESPPSDHGPPAAGPATAAGTAPPPPGPVVSQRVPVDRQPPAGVPAVPGLADAATAPAGGAEVGHGAVSHGAGSGAPGQTVQRARARAEAERRQQQAMARQAPGDCDPIPVDAMDADATRSPRSVDKADVMDAMDQGLKRHLSTIDPAMQRLNDIDAQIRKLYYKRRYYKHRKVSVESIDADGSAPDNGGGASLRPPAINPAMQRINAIDAQIRSLRKRREQAGDGGGRRVSLEPSPIDPTMQRLNDIDTRIKNLRRKQAEDRVGRRLSVDLIATDEPASDGRGAAANPGPASAVPPGMLTANQEPLPFGDELPVDDFANYIENTIPLPLPFGDETPDDFADHIVSAIQTL